MTVEGLDGKAELAEQLALRDQAIISLLDLVEKAGRSFARLRRSQVGYGRWVCRWTGQRRRQVRRSPCDLRGNQVRAAATRSPACTLRLTSLSLTCRLNPTQRRTFLRHRTGAAILPHAVLDVSLLAPLQQRGAPSDGGYVEARSTDVGREVGRWRTDSQLSVLHMFWRITRST